MMKPKLLLLAAAGMTAGCTTHYQIADVSRQRIVIDSRYERTPDAKTVAFMSPYNQKVDSMRGPVIGQAARSMEVQKPESELSNLYSDILLWAAKDYGEQPAFGVHNVGGIRAALTKGPVTFGDINEMSPFENKIAFTTLSGAKVTELFKQIAKRGGEGVSRGVELLISADGQLLSARLNGKEIEQNKDYRVVTVDYIVQGNDGMPAFCDGTDLVSPQNENDNMRYIIARYFKMMAAQGKAVDAQLEGRIRIVDGL